jgi:hypothetical protein
MGPIIVLYNLTRCDDYQCKVDTLNFDQFTSYRMKRGNIGTDTKECYQNYFPIWIVLLPIFGIATTGA